MKIKVKETIEQKGLSIRETAKKCDIWPSTLISICADQVMPRLDTLERIAIGLSCRISDLYDSPYK